MPDEFKFFISMCISALFIFHIYVILYLFEHFGIFLALAFCSSIYWLIFKIISIWDSSKSNILG